MARLRANTRALGFTLVELLVALTISSIVVLAVNESFRLGLRLWHRVEDRRPIEEQARQIVRVARAELAGLYYPAGDASQEGASKPFEYVHDPSTGEQRVSFFTTTPSHYRGLPPGRCARVTYEFHKSGGEDGRGGEPELAGGVLVRREQLVAGGKAIAEPISAVIAEGLSAFSIECEQNKGQAGGESGEFDSRPPSLVRLKMSWPATDAVTGRSEAVSFSAQFTVPVNGQLLESRQAAEGQGQ